MLGLAGNALGAHWSIGSGTVVPSLSSAARSYWSQFVGIPTFVRVDSRVAREREAANEAAGGAPRETEWPSAPERHKP